MCHREREAHIFMGPDGVGKTTMAALIAELISGSHIDSGKLVRSANELKSDPALTEIMATRQLAPESLVRGLVTREIDVTTGDICFSGIPRAKEQAEWLNCTLTMRGIHIVGVYCLKAEVETCLDRISKRTDRPNTVKLADQEQSIRTYNDMMDEACCYFEGVNIPTVVIEAEPALDVVRGAIESLPQIQRRISSLCA